jgi:AraC family transcriptional regulator, transcriptional activator of pobA
MKASESITSFLQQQGQTDASASQLREAVKSGRFHVYDVEQFCQKALAHNRRDFYKISLLLGPGEFHYADRRVVIDRPALVFSNPLVPYSWEGDLAAQSGYFCLFTEDFLFVNDRGAGLQDSPLFKIGSDPVFFLDEAQLGTVRHLFRQLLTEQDSTYPYKQDLLRTYVNLLLHEALKMQPQHIYYPPQNATARLVTLFTELLERQFPIDSPGHTLKLRTANDFAGCLSVHVNHLNRALRELTGKSTTTHIAERIISEAKALLQHTSWPVADIAYGLGFEYPTYFNNFFKKQTGLTPTALRA